MMRQNFLQVFSDIRFWIVFFFCLRLIGITDPPLEISHNWRQVTVNMVARNFYEGEADLFYPQMDNAGEKSGITGTEFPLLNYLIALVASIFGWEHWYGRIINLVISSLGIWYFYLWIRDFINSRVAFPSAMILLTSLWFTFSRKMMPDTFSLSISMIGLYYGFKYLTDNKRQFLLIYFITATIGVLCKLPAIVVLSPLFIRFIGDWHKNKEFNISFFAISVAIFSVIGFWYIWWFNYLIALGNWQFYMMGPGFPKGFFELLIDPYETFDNIFFECIKFTGFAAFCAGLIILFKDKTNKSILLFIGFWCFLFFLFMIQAGYGYATHDYYTLPLVPALALGAGYGISRISRPALKKACLGLIMLEGIFNAVHDFRIKNEFKYYLEMESFANEFIPKDSRIVCDEGMNPRMIYFLHRKGWSLDPDFIRRNGVIDSLELKGANYLVIHKKNSYSLNYPEVAENDQLICFWLNVPSK